MDKLIEKPEDVSEVLRIFADRQSHQPLLVIENIIAYVRRQHQKGVILSEKNYSYEFLNLGGAALHLHGNIRIPDFCEFLLQKHAAYGAEPLTAWGPLGIVIRIDSKMRRYVNLSTQHPVESISDRIESIMDTLTDIVGYCVLGYILCIRQEKA